MFFLQVFLIHYSSFGAISQSIFINNTASTLWISGCSSLLSSPSQLSLCAAGWSSAHYLRLDLPSSTRGIQVPSARTGLATLSPRDLGVRCGALGACWMNNLRQGGSWADKQSITIRNVGFLLCLSRSLTSLPSSFILSCQGEGISLSVAVQSGQRGRVQSTWIKGLVCSRQGWNWSITGLHLRSVWEGVARPSTKGFPFITFFSLCPL